MIQLTTSLGDHILEHARQCGDAEACGLIVQRDGALVYHPCVNDAPLAKAGGQFIVNKHDWVDAEESGEIVAIVHSHPNGSAHASDADLAMCEKTQLPWVIIGMPSGVIMQYEPKGERLPLVGRTFHHGIVDCYALIQDYFFIRLGIELPDFDRPDDWWVASRGQPGLDLYRKNFELAGFVEIGQACDVAPRAHDVILMQIRSDQFNHAAVMDGDRPGLILHHLGGRLSCHDVWGGSWLFSAGAVIRHHSLLGS